MRELKRCPFCGNDARLFEIPPFVHPRNGSHGPTRWQVMCHVCGVSTAGMLSREDAEDAWNRRATDGQS